MDAHRRGGQRIGAGVAAGKGNRAAMAFGQRRTPADRFRSGIQVLLERAVEGAHAGKKFFTGFRGIGQAKLVGILADLGR